MATYSAVRIDPTGVVHDVLRLEGSTMTQDEAAAYLIHHLELNQQNVQPGEYRMVTSSEYKRLVWQRDWAALTPNERDLYAALWPRLNTEGFDPATSKTVAQLKAVAHHRMHKLGLSETCARCGGTGHFSRNQRFGTTCFKCGGQAHTPGCGYQMPKITSRIIAQVRERMTTAVLSETGEIIKAEG